MVLGSCHQLSPDRCEGQIERGQNGPLMGPPWPGCGYSDWSFLPMFSFDARLAGSIPARIATPTKNTSVPAETANTIPYPAVAVTEGALAALDTDDVEQRLLVLLDTFNPIAVEEEAHFRRALLVYLDTWLRSRRAGEEPPAVREGRRMRWLDQVLAPLDDLPEEQRRRLQTALALTLGPDSLVVMKDVCGLDDDEALDVLRWAATAMPRAGLAETHRPGTTQRDLV